MAQDTPWKTRSHIIELKRQGLTTAQTAEQLGVSPRCVKKFWRRFSEQGMDGLQVRSRRPKTHPRRMSASVRESILQIKRAHPHWGGQFIQGALRRRRLRHIPHRRTIERFLYQFPEFPKRRYQHREPLTDPCRATRLHQLWQADFKVNHRFAGCPQRKSFLNIRDMASTQCILSYTLPGGRSALTSREVIQVVRSAFSRWKCVPEAIRTDHGSCFCGPEWDAFPTDFRLYLWGMGIEHELIPVRCPRHNGGVERDQRTFGEQFLADYTFDDHSQLAKDAESFGRFRNHYVPSRSVRCQGRTPEESAQHLESWARAYHPAREAEQFKLERIYEKLASLRWRRLVSGGYVALGHAKYYVGRAYAGQSLELSFDRDTREVVATTVDHQPVKRWAIRGISYHEIVYGQERSKLRCERSKTRAA